MDRIVVIGGGGAGTGAATTAIQTDRSLDVTLITEFEDIAYSPCGIPYVFGREIEKFDGLFLQTSDFYHEMTRCFLGDIFSEANTSLYTIY